MTNLHQRLRNFLDIRQVKYEEIHHDEATTCEQSAKERGRDLKIGGKTLLMKDKKGFHMFVLSAAKQLDSNRVRKILECQKVRFAKPEEFLELTGVPKGALPPFGNDFLPFNLYLDESILKNDEIAFNAGLLTVSFILKLQDYLELVVPTICSFSKED